VQLTPRQVKLLEILHLARMPIPASILACELDTSTRRLRDDVLAIVREGEPVIVTEKGVVIARTDEQVALGWEITDSLHRQADALREHAEALAGALRL
jgi:hypothetical protein